MAVLLAAIAMLLTTTTTRGGDGPPAEKFLGPTGIFGTVGKNDFTVTKVAAGTPAHGKITGKDVIIGVNGKQFEGDVRKAIAAAIVHAETPKGNGVLTLMLRGKPRLEKAPKLEPEPGDDDPFALDDKKPAIPNSHNVTLKLEVLGTYAPTAPYDCALTDKLITRAADWSVKTGDYKNGQMSIGWLGLMATGEQKYLEIVKRDLPKEEWVKPDKEKFEALLRGDIDMGYVCWSWGYRMAVLAEYHMITGEDWVLEPLRIYATTLARGQDPAGRWGHRLATVKRDGRLPGYSHINNPSLSCLVGLVLARKAGIDDPVIDKAIERSYTAYLWYVGEGAIPYGNHPPRSSQYNNNGSSAMAGLMMAFLQDVAAAEFFAHQSATAYGEIEGGHATNYFNILWTPLGANLAGPEVTQQFFDRTLWLHTLARTSDGYFTHYGKEQKAGNSTASHLLAYCLGRRALYVTGKEANRSLWLDKEKATEVVNVSQIDVKSKTSDELVALLAHPAPKIRRDAGWLLRSREPSLAPALIKLIKTGTTREKVAAVGFFGDKCPENLAIAHMDTIGAVLRNQRESIEVRAAAAETLAWRGEAAYGYFEDVVRLLAKNKPTDKLKVTDAQLGKALVQLCADPFAAGIVKDEVLFYEAMNKLADHPFQGARGCAMRLLFGMPIEDFHIVGDMVKKVARNRSPTSTSYHNPHSSMTPAVKLLAKFNVEEGMQWAWDTLKTPDGKHSFKMRAVLEALTAYGPHARPYLDQINGDEKMKRSFSSGRFKGLYDKLVAAVNTTTPRGQLISFGQAMRIDAKP